MEKAPLVFVTALATTFSPLAEEGHRVSFRNANQERGIKKDVVTYTTKDRDAAYEWASQMGNDGYEVFINYDKTTGVYTCVASK